MLSRATVDYDGKGLAEVTIKALENGTNNPGPETISAVAHALGVPPQEFPEYRLALARAQLDENEIGLDQALANLAQFEAALARPRKVSGREAQPADTSHRPGRAGQSAGRRSRAT